MDIQILLMLQDFRNGAGAFLAEFMSKMTFFGDLNTVIVIMAIIYWGVSKEFGTYLMMGWSGNRLANGLMKVTVCAYRPWIRDARIVPYGNSITTATGYSFPSGHSMNASTVFGGIIVRRDMARALRITAGIMVFLVAFSRNFLGVHMPQDTLVGPVVGLTMMALTVRLMKWVEAHPEKDLLVMGVGIALAIAIAAFAFFKHYPEDYDAQGKLLVDGTKMAADTFKGVGWCSGFLIGWVLDRRFVHFSSDAPMVRRVTRVMTGLLGYYVVSLIVMPFIKNVLPGSAGTVVSSFVQLLYITFLLPLCVVRLEKPLATVNP